MTPETNAEIASIKATSSVEFRQINKRLAALEIGQQRLVSAAIQGKVGLKVFLWIGGFLAGAAALFMGLWKWDG